MWQRVQTLYLALATALIASMFFCDKAGEITYLSYLPYTVLLAVTLILEILALTTFRYRVFQFRTAILSSLILTGFQAWLAVDFFVTGNDPVFHISAVFPVTAVILDVLAARNIWADELMVRSASRLRGARKNNKKTSK